MSRLSIDTVHRQRSALFSPWLASWPPALACGRERWLTVLHFQSEVFCRLALSFVALDRGLRQVFLNLQASSLVHERPCSKHPNSTFKLA